MIGKSSLNDVLIAIQQIEQAYRSRSVRRDISPNDDMLNSACDREKLHYFAIGADAIDIILESMLLGRTTELRSVLDMPCGFGRVTRHLKVAFPDAALYACDLYQNRIDFCATEFDTVPIKSKELFDDIVFPINFDLIWCGSLLTHLTAWQFHNALRLLSRSLNPGGLAIVTLHGRHSLFIQHHKWKYLPDESFAVAEAEFRANGFGYTEYNMPEVFFEQASYGVSLSAPSYAIKCLEDDESVTIKAYVERRWDDHQDVLVFQKTPLNL